MRKITAVLAGAGARGMVAYGTYALKHPNELKFVAVAEPDATKRALFQSQHGIADDRCFESWEQLLAMPRLADAILICTLDGMHFAPAVQALQKGYHVLLEKPMSNDPLECVAFGECARKYGSVVSVCHVLRYTDFFSKIKEIVDSGRIGRLVSIQHNENVAFWHQAHSFVRGNWRNQAETSPMILQKSCHDMDILLWLSGGNCNRLSSFGSLAHFRPENAPAGAPDRCLDGCPAEHDCPYYAPKTYLTDNVGWPASVISIDTSLEARTRALREGPYGRCVYRCDNDVVDHQVVSMEFDNGVTAVFTMCAFTQECNRTIKLMGTAGELRASDGKNEIEIRDFARHTTEIIRLPRASSGHGGGDFEIMYDFLRQVAGEGGRAGLTAASKSVQSHLMAFAAERSRLEGRTIDMADYERDLKDKIL